MSTKLYVGNLPFQTSSGDLEQLFVGHGTVESVNIITDRDTGRSRGFGFVEMASQAEAEEAIKQLNGKEVDGRSLTVNAARPREEGGRTSGPRTGNGRQDITSAGNLPRLLKRKPRHLHCRGSFVPCALSIQVLTRFQTESPPGHQQGSLRPVAPP